MNQLFAQKKLVIVFVIGVFLALLLSSIGLDVPPPASWLWAWTNWIAAAVGIVVSARVLWSGGTLLGTLTKAVDCRPRQGRPPCGQKQS